MNVYIGMDISLQLTHLCVVDNEGKTVREGVAGSDLAALDAWLRTHGSDWTIQRIVLEPVTNYLFWIYPTQHEIDGGGVDGGFGAFGAVAIVFGIETVVA